MPRHCLLLTSPGLVLAGQMTLTLGLSPPRWLRKQFYSVDRNREDRWVPSCALVL